MEYFPSIPPSAAGEAPPVPASHHCLPISIRSWAGSGPWLAPPHVDACGLGPLESA